MKSFVLSALAVALLSGCVSAPPPRTVEQIAQTLQGGFSEEQVVIKAGSQPKTVEFLECGGDDGFESWQCKVYEYKDHSGRTLRIFFSSSGPLPTGTIEWNVANWILD
jgi:hypothetical protein